MNKKHPWWLYPNLLSLDAPLVAVAWMWILAASLRVVYVETYAYWMVAAAVWCVYVLDRIFDVVKHNSSSKGHPVLSARHEFHWRHRKIFIPLVILVIVYTVYVAFNVASEALLSAGVSGFVLVLFYLWVRKIDIGEVTYLKNFLAGIIFAYGVSAPIMIESEHLNYSLSDVYYHFTASSSEGVVMAVVNGVYNCFQMLISSLDIVMFMTPLPLLFGLLCFLNITAIDLWEKSRRTENEEEKEFCEAILSIALMVLVAVTVFVAAFKLTEMERTLCYVLMVSAALLQFLNKKRSMFYLDAQRVLADLFMVLPLPLVWLLS